MNNLHSLRPIPSDRKLNVCAYCRISNNKEELETSLVEQVAYYSELILTNENWKLAGIFADDGISGTTMDKRKQFTVMLDKALSGSIDIIITKSISRFARNVIDLLGTVHELRSKGVEILFERENFSSLDTKSDMMLTIYAKFAEEEAISVSKNVKWRNQVNLQNGNYHINTGQLLGYRYDESKQIRIVEHEAVWIRKIFELYTQEVPVRKIGEFLKQNKVLSPLGNIHWNSTTIRNILKNEKYVGDCLMQKTYTVDPLTHKKVRNEGELPQVLITNGHPPIIDRQTWDKAQSLMKDRCQKFHIRKGDRSPNRLTPWTSFLYCPYCNKNYVMTVSRATKRQILVDTSNRETKTCLKGQSVYVDVLEKVMIEQVHILLSNFTSFKKSLTEAIKDNTLRPESEEQAVQSQIDVLQERLKELKNSDSEANRIATYKVKEQLRTLIQKKILLQNESMASYTPTDKMNRILQALKKIKSVSSIEDIDFKEIFSKVIVYDRDHLVFLIGSSDCCSIKKKIKTIFNGSMIYKQRATNYTVHFGIYIQF